jgi:hypothetical protein
VALRHKVLFFHREDRQMIGLWLLLIVVAWVLALISAIPYGGRSVFVEIAVYLTFGFLAYLGLWLVDGVLRCFKPSPTEKAEVGKHEGDAMPTFPSHIDDRSRIKPGRKLDIKGRRERIAVNLLVLVFLVIAVPAVFITVLKFLGSR